MITFISSFQGYDNPQKNAVYTWVLNSIPLILVGPIKLDLSGVSYVTDARTEACLGRGGDAPFIKDMILKSLPYVSTSMIGLINQDILIQEDFSEVFSNIIDKHGENVFLTSCRYDIEYGDKIESINALKEAQKNRTLHQDQSGDIFIASKANFERMANQMPDLLVGRMVWDNWIHMYFKNSGIPCFNTTYKLPIYHISHGYAHLPSGSFQHCPGISHNINLFKNSGEYARFSGEYVRVLQLPEP